MLKKSSPALEVVGLTKTFPVRTNWFARRVRGQPIRATIAVQDVSFHVDQGETYALIGESGSGKSTIARCVAGIARADMGTIRLFGDSVSKVRGSEGRRPRNRVQMIFQDPYSSLNPRWRADDIIAEPLVTLGLIRNGRQKRERVTELLMLVGLSPDDAHKFPHQFSGGQRQRIAIARALSAQPGFLIADEPTSALDVSVQAQILNLLRDLQKRLGLGMLFISHNLAVVAHMADRIGVLYRGRLVEEGPADAIIRQPLNEYTQRLFAAVPDIEEAMAGSRFGTSASSHEGSS